MIFTTYWFLTFVTLVVGLYWLLPRRSLRLGFLGLACLVFHAHFAGPAGMAPIIALMIVTYFAGLSRRNSFCIAAIACSVLTLVFYKYSLFLIQDAIDPFFRQGAASLTTYRGKFMPSLPPLGISFFVFEFVHYLMEIRRGNEPIKNPLKFLIFSIFFPSLVAGPIKRYQPFLASMEMGSTRFRIDYISSGLTRIATGYIKKVALADNLTFFIDFYHPQFASLSLLDRWWFTAALAFRILLDFSGYSDIAIGTARLLGIRLPENFDWPYLATSIQEFWQSWHISLTSWIRDYIYIPLGGNRHGPIRQISNGLIAFALCGLWHGAAWNYVLWGVYHGVGLGVAAKYKTAPGVGPILGKIFNREPYAAWLLTQLFVFLGWLLFFYPAAEAWKMARLLFNAS